MLDSEWSADNELMLMSNKMNSIGPKFIGRLFKRRTFANFKWEKEKLFVVVWFLSLGRAESCFSEMVNFLYRKSILNAKFKAAINHHNWASHTSEYHRNELFSAIIAALALNSIGF